MKRTLKIKKRAAEKVLLAIAVIFGIITFGVIVIANIPVIALVTGAIAFGSFFGYMDLTETRRKSRRAR